MDLDSSGFSGTTFLDGRRSITDIPHTPTPNTSHGQLFSQNTSLLMGHTHDMHMSSDSSPLNMFSPPLDPRLSRVSDEELLASGNTAYLQSQLVVERQRRKIGEMDNQIRGLEMEIMMWKTRSMNTQETLDKLIQNIPRAGLASNPLLSCKDIPPPLDPKAYPQVRYWTSKSFDTQSSKLVGETDALATQQKRRGPPRKSEVDDDRHPYLENKDGSAVSREVLVKVGQMARRIWHGLVPNGLAPSSWGKASEIAYRCFNSEMLNEPEFEFFRYCESNWKMKRWAGKAYASWARNHMKSSDAGDNKTPYANKRKREPLDDPSLLQINDDSDENIASAFPPSDPSPIENTSDSLATPAPSASAFVQVPIQQPAISLVDPLDEIYNEVDDHTESSAANPPTIPQGNSVASSSASTRIVSSSSTSTLMTSSSTNSATIASSSTASAVLNTSCPTPTTTTHPPPLTATSSEKENHETHDSEPKLVDNNATGITDAAQCPGSTLSTTTPPLVSINNDRAAGQRQNPAKRMKGLAVVGTGLTDKNFCMKDWIEENPNGLKDAFELYFKALPANARKTYKDRAIAAQKAARMGKKKALDTNQPGAQ